MTDDRDASFLATAVLDLLIEDAEALLVLAVGLQGPASEMRADANPKNLRANAAILRTAAIHIAIAANSLVTLAERLRIVAEFWQGQGGGDLPS